MQMAVAAYFVLTTTFSVLSTLIFINHDSLLKVMQAQGNLPQGTDIGQVVNIALGVVYAFLVFFAILYLVAAIGSYLGWRWMFWAVLVLLGFGSIGAITNLGNFSRPNQTELPVWSIAVSEVFSLIALALFVWLIVGLVKYGPWAMKKPGP